MFFGCLQHFPPDDLFDSRLYSVGTFSVLLQVSVFSVGVTVNDNDNDNNNNNTLVANRFDGSTIHF